MMKSEFEERIGAVVSDDHYRIIETVYCFYPGIPDVGGKDAVANLYKQFGILIFADMHRRAAALGQIDRAKSALNAKAGKYEATLFPDYNDLG